MGITTSRFFSVTPVLFVCILCLGCGEDKASEDTDSEALDVTEDIDENCDMGCISAGACLGNDGEVDYAFTCPAEDDVCCNLDESEQTRNVDTAAQSCSYSCVDFNACEMTNMHMEMSCDAGVCCDTRDNNPDAADNADPCRFNCVPYASCERYQIHPEQVCYTAGQICCDGEAVFIPDTDSETDTQTAYTDDTETGARDEDTGDTTSDSFETDATDVDSDGTDEETDGTDTMDSEMADTNGDSETGTGSDSIADTDSVTDTDAAVGDTESDSDTLLDCEYFCVAADQCVLTAYHSEMYCATAGTVCCDI